MTATTDSLHNSTPGTATDSLLIIPAAAAADTRLDTRLDTALIASRPAVTPVTPTDTAATALVLPPWMSGIEPDARVMQPGHNSGFMLVLALMFVVLIFNFRHLSRLMKTYSEELVKVRSGRDNVFDERPAGDARVTMMLVAMAIISCGILLATAVCRVLPDNAVPSMMTSGKVAAVITVCAAYYCFLLAGYNLVGYTFTSPERHHDWVRAFNASQAMLGIALVIPAVLAIFYPRLAPTVVIIGLILYLLARVLFIFKGFRIFYNNIGSLVYFILYLCTLEIIPLIFVIKCARILVSHTS